MRASNQARNDLLLLAENGNGNGDGNGHKKVLLVIASKFKHPILVAANTIQEITNLGLNCNAEPFRAGRNYQIKGDVSLVLFFTRRKKVVSMKGVQTVP